MRGIAYLRCVVLGLPMLLMVTGPASSIDIPTGAVVKGVVRVDGPTPKPKEWELDAIMKAHTGEKIYREETWLVGNDQGLGNCVVTLKAKDPVKRIPTKPMENVILDKVGVRYVPRVLVVTSKTEVTLRNKESPCRGFHIEGAKPLLSHSVDVRVPEGQQHTFHTRKGPDICSVCCPVRRYTKGYLHIVDTPHFAVTDANGRFTIRGIPAGEYEVTVWHEAIGKFKPDAGPKEVKVQGSKESILNYLVRVPDKN